MEEIKKLIESIEACQEAGNKLTLVQDPKSMRWDLKLDTDGPGQVIVKSCPYKTKEVSCD